MHDFDRLKMLADQIESTLSAGWLPPYEGDFEQALIFLACRSAGQRGEQGRAELIQSLLQFAEILQGPDDIEAIASHFRPTKFIGISDKGS